MATIEHWSHLAPVVDALVRAAAHDMTVLVERSGGRWRWSPVHARGPHPLQQVLARYLGVSHLGVALAFDTRPDGCCVVQRADDAEVDAVVALDPSMSRDEILQRVLVLGRS